MPYRDPEKRKECYRRFRQKNASHLRQYARDWRAKNKEKLNAERRDGRRKEETKRRWQEVEKHQKEQNAERNRARRYGMTVEGFNTLLKKQHSKCALCFELLKFGGKAIHIDHCHNSKAVRGILCARCNLGLGRFGDNVEGLLQAIAYLERTDNDPTWRNFYGQ